MTAPPISIIEALDDPELFNPWFTGQSWVPWRTILKAAFGLPLLPEEEPFFRSVADRNPPTEQVKELWIVAGRRAGKDSVASVVAAYAAALFAESGQLRPGERALVACLAVDRDQAKVVLNYTRSYFTDIPLLKGMIERETAYGFELSNKIDIAVSTNSFRAVRGRPILCAVLDELAFWRDEGSSTPDEETYKALVPGLATMPGSMIIGISSPYRKSGLLYKKYRGHYGKPGNVLVIKAPTLLLNPTIDPTIVAKALEDDPAAARAEWLAEFRDDISALLPRELVEAAIDRGLLVRPPIANARYFGFADMSGGVSDAASLAISHKEGEHIVLDCLTEHPAPHNPVTVAATMAATLKSYGLRSVKGDRYAATWVVQAFAANGITYRHSERDRSAIYLEALPLFSTGRAHLLDNNKLVNQLASLERRTSSTRDRIDHPPGGHDDLANAACGAMALAAAKSNSVLAGAIVFSAGPTIFPGSTPSDAQHRVWDRVLRDGPTDSGGFK